MAERIMFTSSSSSSLDESQSNAGSSSGSNADSSNKSKENSKKETKKSKTIKKDRRDPRRFLGEGVNFKAKLIGVRDVPQARGEKMAQETLQELKINKKTSGAHKRKIVINICLDGLKIKDEKLKEVIYLHPVHKISFISQDASDNRAFGYIYGSPDNVHTFYAIKTEKAAHQIVMCMRDLFHIAFELKKKEIEQWRQQQANQQTTNHSPSTSLGCESSSGSVISDNSVKSRDASSPSSSNSSTSGFSNRSRQSDPFEDPPSLKPDGYTGSLLLDLTVDRPRINDAFLTSDMLGPLDERATGDAFFSDPWGYLRAMSSASDLSDRPDVTQAQNDPFIVDSSSQQMPIPSIFFEPSDLSPAPCPISPFPSDDPFNTSFVNSPFSNFTSTPVPITNPAAAVTEAAVLPTAVGDDKYAALVEISSDNSSEAPTAIQTCSSSSSSVEAGPLNEGFFASSLGLSASEPTPPTVVQHQASSPLPPPLVSTSVFSDLDPLGKDRPYVDKKDFFYDVKNPPKKVLKDLIAENGFSAPEFDLQEPELPVEMDSCPPPSIPPPLPPPFYRRSMTSPTSSLEDASMAGSSSSSSVGSATSSPVGEVLLPPPPPPPPRSHVNLPSFLPPPPPLPPKNGSHSSHSSDSGSPVSDAPLPLAMANTMLSSLPIPIPNRRGRTAFTSPGSSSSSSMMSSSSVSLSTTSSQAQNPKGYYSGTTSLNGDVSPVEDPNNNPLQNRPQRPLATTISSWSTNCTTAIRNPNEIWNYGQNEKSNNQDAARNDANAMLTNRLNQCNISNPFTAQEVFLSPPPQFTGTRRHKVGIFQKEEDPFADDDFFAAIKADSVTPATAPNNNGGVWNNPFVANFAQNR